MTGWEARGARLGARLGTRAVAAAAERIARAAQHDVPDDVRVVQEGATVVLSGRDLKARSIDDARLRGFGLAGDLR